MRQEHGSGSTRWIETRRSRFLCASDTIWSHTNTLLHPETRRIAWLFSYRGEGVLSIYPPPAPALRGGRVRITKQTSRCAPHPPYSFVFDPPAKKILNFFACQTVTIKCNSAAQQKTGEIRWQFMDTHASQLKTRLRTHRSTIKHAKSKASRSHTIWN